MADSIDELETIRISELDTASVVDKNHDYLVISHPTTMALDNWQTLKATPAQVMADAGLAYTAGEHINISSSNVISASFDNATTQAAGLMSAQDKSKLSGIADNANNYTLPVADANTLGGVKAGTGVTIANDGTISAQGQTYTAGNNIQISNANVISATDTTYSDATTEASGLMSYTDKIKLNGIADNANNYSLPIADANTLGGVKQGSNISIAADGTISAINLGNAVVANPASQSTATLTKLSVDGTVYEVSSGGGSASISTLTDVTLTSLSDGQILKYDATNQKWINANESGGGTEVEKGTIQNVAIASFSDGADNVPVSSLIVDIDAVQAGSGTPSPDNVRPITGFTGANVAVKGANLFSLTEDTVRADKKGSLSAYIKTDTSVTATSTADNYAYFGRFIFLPKGTYCIKFQATSSDVGYTPTITLYRDGPVVIRTNIQPNTPTTFTLTDNIIIEVRMFATKDNDATIRTVTFSDIQIEKGNSVSENYIPYVGNTTAITWQDEAGTVYGGSLNVKTGELTIGSGYDNAQNMSWVKHGTSSNNIYYSNSKQSIVKKPQDGHTTVGGLSCSVAEEKAWESLFVSGVSGIAIATTGLVAIALPTITSLEDFNAIANQIQIVYPLATPTTVQLTPTEVRSLLNDNNIFADTGNINELVYFKTGCESITELIEAYDQKDITQTVLLEAAEWNSTTNTITVDVAGVTTTSNQEILPLEATSSANISNNIALQSANIMDAGQASGTITLYAENVPSTDLQIRVIVRA